jgi:hypothetical protein
MCHSRVCGNPVLRVPPSAQLPADPISERRAAGIELPVVNAGQSPPGRVHPRPGQEEIKPVMHFVGKQKGLILTGTNQDFLRATFGDPIQGLLLRSGRAGERGEGFARKLTCLSILPHNS